MVRDRVLALQVVRPELAASSACLSTIEGVDRHRRRSDGAARYNAPLRHGQASKSGEGEKIRRYRTSSNRQLRRPSEWYRRSVTGTHSIVNRVFQESGSFGSGIGHRRVAFGEHRGDSGREQKQPPEWTSMGTRSLCRGISGHRPLFSPGSRSGSSNSPGRFRPFRGPERMSRLPQYRRTNTKPLSIL